MSHSWLHDARLYHLLLLADRELAAEARTAGCPCGGTLHSARYARKPRGWLPPELEDAYAWRESLCCACDGCRRRRTPPSLRFLGPRVYLAAIVVLISAMTGGVTIKRAGQMHELIGVSLRTLQRWRAWWLGTFPRTVFWHAAQGRFVPPLDLARLPAALVAAFSAPDSMSLLACLRFLAPITIAEGCAVAA